MASEFLIFPITCGESTGVSNGGGALVDGGGSTGAGARRPGHHHQPVARLAGETEYGEDTQGTGASGRRLRVADGGTGSNHASRSNPSGRLYSRAHPVQGLHWALLVHNVAHLLHEERIGRELEALHPMRLQAESAPDTGHRHVREPGGARHRARAPVRGLVWLGLQGARHDFFHLGVANLARSARAGFIHQAFQAGSAKALPPLAHGAGARPALPGHGLVRKAFGATQNDAGSQGQALCGFRSPRPLLQFLMLLVPQNQRLLGASCTITRAIQNRQTYATNLCYRTLSYAGHFLTLLNRFAASSSVAWVLQNAKRTCWQPKAGSL